MTATVLFFVAGLILLIGGAELLVRGASDLAARLGMSTLVIGLTVVAFGTSAPELAISLQSGTTGEDALLLGNVIGSNIFNVLFILGISALIIPLAVSKRLIKLDVPLVIAVSILLYFFAWNGVVSRIEGAILLMLLIGYLSYLIYDTRKRPNNQNSEKNDFSETVRRRLWFWDAGYVTAGFLMLVVGARWLVYGAVTFAEYMGVSSLIIGMTIVAFGTSLPEVATSVTASFKGERDMAVGNIVGSNLFNILCIIGLTAVVLPDGIAVEQGVIGFDIPVMIGAAILCLPVFFTDNEISRWEGLLFLGYYIAFTIYLILTATEHNLLPLFNIAMNWFVLPMTVITVIVILIRKFRTNNF